MRLRAALGELYLSSSTRPGRDERVFPSLDAKTLRTSWARIATRADLPAVRMKDLRDTYASHLLTRGISIQWVSRQLGHGSIGVTQSHYARYLGAGEDHVYVEPARLEPGEVPADLLARLADCSQIAHTGDVFTIPVELQVAEIQ
jgi:integrase